MAQAGRNKHVDRKGIRIGPEERRIFAENGCILVRKVATKREVDSARRYIGRVVAEMAGSGDKQGRLDDYSRIFHQVTNAWRLDENIARFVFKEKFARIAAALMGVKSVRLYHDQALFKPPGGERTYWHQDMFYWPLDTDKTVTMWMPLVDVTMETGTLVFACGSHKSGLISDKPISSSNEEQIERLIPENRFERRSYELKAGDATFHTGYTVHSAFPNRGATTREVMTIIYYADGTRLAKSMNNYQEVDAEVFLPGVKPGEIAASPLNPLLFPVRRGRRSRPTK